jgi:menaquinone-dependent protoporphyrinogen oxidase
MSRILVIYGTTEGHTEQIATAIGNALTASGFDVHTIQAGTLDPRPADYDGIIVSASVHGGRYQKPVERWIRAHAAELHDKPSAFVSSCLGILQHDPKVDAELDAIIHRFIDPLGWRPAVIKPVAGALVYSKYNLLKRWVMKRIAAKAGGGTDTSRDYDYTDWDDLQAFAADFGQRVAAGSIPRSRAAGREISSSGGETFNAQ